VSGLILHTYCRSSSAYRVRIALELKQLPYESRPVNLLQGEQRSPAYLELNAQGLVPTLVDGDVVINQSLAILEYLEETYPQYPLLPASPADRAEVRALAQLVAVDTQPLNNLRVLRFLTDQLDLDERRKMRWYRHWISRNFSALERRLSAGARTGHYCFGDAPGLADACLVPQVYNALRFDCELDAYPNITRIHAACMELPAFRRAAPEAQPDFAPPAR